MFHKVRLSLPVLLIGLVPLMPGCGVEQAERSAADPGHHGDQAASSDEWGIEVLGVRLTAADYMLDFRYRVIDGAKAAKAVNPHNRPYLVEEATGARFRVPAPVKVGELRNTGRALKAGHTYFALFANPARHIKRGDRVTVAMGDFRALHVTVE